MLYKNTTQVPNYIFDHCLPRMTEAELKVALIIIRQTIGWKDKKTGKRKVRDRISRSQFQLKTGLSSRTISTAISSLVAKKLIDVMDYSGKCLVASLERKGKFSLYYSLSTPAQNLLTISEASLPIPEQKATYNKTKALKVITSKLSGFFEGHIGEVLLKMLR